jgi:hypothetical protein
MFFFTGGRTSVEGNAYSVLNMVSWVVMPCDFVGGYQHFGGNIRQWWQYVPVKHW